MNLARQRFTSILVPVLAVAVVVNLASCGTILYPEREGQRVGKIDPGVAILDGVGLLFFIIPGVIAFAVDFSNHTIYLPHSHTSSIDTPHRYAQIHFNGRLDPAAVEGYIRAETGKEVRLQQSSLEVVRLDSLADLDARFARYDADSHIALAQ